MKDFDAMNAKRNDMYNAVASALASGNEEAVISAMKELQEANKQELLDLHAEFEQTHDEAVLEARGVKALTSEETTFWNKFIDMARADFRNEGTSGVYTGLMERLPETEYESIIAELKKESPLLNAIDFTSTSAVTKWTVDASPEQRATWHALNTPITNELFGGPFKTVDMTLCKLTSFIVVSNDMLDLGPRWIAAYALQMLKTSTQLGLEYGIILGNGNEEPIGMMRDFLQPKDRSEGYPMKDAIKIDSFSPETYASICTILAQKDNGRTRRVTKVGLVVNPIDYLTKIFVATTGMTASLNYVKDIFPFPTDVYISEFVPSGKAVMGIMSDYFMGLGSAKGGNIESSDHARFLEDQRVYKTKLYGNGESKQSNGFVVLDISNIGRDVPEFASTTKPVKAVAKSVALTNVTLDKSFDKLALVYNGTTTSASTKVTATAVSGATATITADGASVTDGNVSLTLDKTTKIEVKVVLGDSETKYVFNVTRVKA